MEVKGLPSRGNFKLHKPHCTRQRVDGRQSLYQGKEPLSVRCSCAPGPGIPVPRGGGRVLRKPGVSPLLSAPPSLRPACSTRAGPVGPVLSGEGPSQPAHYIDRTVISGTESRGLCAGPAREPRTLSHPDLRRQLWLWPWKGVES